MRQWVWGLAVMGFGCGSDEIPQPTDGMTEDEVIDQMEAVLDTSTILPLKEPNRGELTIAGVGSHHFQGLFTAEAWQCDEPRFVSVVVQTDSIDVIFLFYVSSVDPIADYRVTPSTEQLFAEGEVRVGVQLIRGRQGAIFRGTGGTVRFTDGSGASGDFEVTLEEVATEAIVTKIRGRFHEVDIRPADPEECTLNATAFVEPEPGDSVPAAREDSTPPDSVGFLAVR